MAPPPFVYENCCGLLSLRTGSFVVAYTYLVADLVMSTTIIAGAMFLDAAKESLDADQQRRLPDIPNTEGIMLGLYLLMLPFITILLVGLHKNRALYIRIFLLGVFAYNILELSMFFLNFYYNISVYLLAAHLLVLIIEMYFFIVLRSYYYKMIQGN